VTTRAIADTVRFAGCADRCDAARISAIRAGCREQASETQAVRTRPTSARASAVLECAHRRPSVNFRTFQAGVQDSPSGWWQP
jgi:hypothetical protein